MVYMLTFTINIPQMLAYIPYMDPMGSWGESKAIFCEANDYDLFEKAWALESEPYTAANIHVICQEPWRNRRNRPDVGNMEYPSDIIYDTLW